MSTIVAVMVAKPLGALIVFSAIRYCTEMIRYRLPDSRLKRVLFYSWRA